MPRLRLVAMSSSLAALLLAGGCPSTGRESRFVAVHNTLEAMGYSQVGHISQGSLPQGDPVREPVTLEAGACYTFLAIGEGGVTDADLTLQDPAGETVAQDDDVDTQASIYHCAQTSGRYTLTLKFEIGSGEYLLASWTGASVGRGGAGPIAARTGTGRPGTCGNPLPLRPDESVTGDTGQGDTVLSATCAEGAAPEMVYAFTLTERAQVSARIESTHDGVLYIQRECGQPQSEVGCNDDAPDTSHSRVDAVLDPGTYFVVVDGYGGNRGTYTLLLSTSPGQPIGQVCADAPVLTAGLPVNGSTVGQADNFRATCGNGAASPDRAYRLEVPQASRVRVFQTTMHHDGVLHVRRSCDDASSELQCSDDHLDRQHSLLRWLADPGSYYVFADGYASGAAGDFSLQADVAPRAGGGAQWDTCSTAEFLQGAVTRSGDTFAAADDYQPTCAPVAGGPDQFFRIDVSRRSRARIAIERAEFGTGILSVMRTCGDRATEVACSAGPLDTILAPGTYSIAVDAATPDAWGRYDVSVALEDTAPMEAACRGARAIRPGTPVTGTTTAPDRFQATCASGAMSGEVVHKLVVRRRSNVRLSLTASHDGVLYIRRDCMDRATELACNDDNPDQQHSLVEATLEPGTYYVFVDGYGNASHGTYTLDTTLTPLAAGAPAIVQPPQPPQPPPGMPGPMPPPMPPVPRP